jgi:hypothetical protein
LVEKAATTVESFKLDAANASVDKTGGTVTITVDRSSTGDLLDSADIHYSTSDGGTSIISGSPYNGSVGAAGTDYTATSGTLHFNSGDSQASFTIPILNNTAIFGDKNFTVTIDSPTTGDTSRIANTSSPTTEVVTIRDERTTNVFQNSTGNATVQPAGPRTGTAGTSFFNVENAGAGANASFGVADFDQGILPFSPPSPVGTINEISISTVTGFPPASFQHSGTFNVYLVDDSSTSIANDGSSPLTFNTTADPTEGLGTQLGARHLLGQINYNSAQPVDEFTSFPLTSTDSATLSTLASDLNGGTKFRIVVTPADGTVAASWEGQSTFMGLFESPVLSFNYTPATAGLPAWLAPGSAATWDAGAHALTVTGPATIIADPGADEPVISASGASAHLTVAPTNTDEIIHVGGLDLESGATADVSSLTGRSHDHHQVLVLGTTTSAAPLFSIDAIHGSKLDLESNDLIVHNGSTSAVQTLAATGRDAAPGGLVDGLWDGDGLTSSAAQSADASAGFEQNVLAVVRNGDLPLTQFSAYAVGSQSEPMRADGNDVIVKYTYNGDFTLEGKVSDDAATIFQAFYDGGVGSGNTFASGDTNGDGKVDDTDATAFQALFGLGTGGGNGSLL